MKTEKTSTQKIVDMGNFKETKAKGATDEFVRKTFDYYGLKVLGNGLIVDRHNHSVTYPKDKVIKYYDYVSHAERKGILLQAIDSCIREIIKQNRDEEEDILFKKLGSCIPDPNSNLFRFCQIIYPEKYNIELNQDRSGFTTCFLIIENFIRQVKQKMNRVPVLEHIMPIFVGPQGVGKSTLLQQLISPLRNFYSHISLKELVDTTRNYPVFANNYILVCEELAGAKWSEYEAIKSTLTASEIEARILGTQQRVLVPNKSTIIGTSNRPSSEVIKDPTGSRRFFDIEVKHKIDFDALDNIDFTALWLGISYDLGKQQKKEFFDSIDKLIRPIQLENKFKDLLEEFVDNYCLEPGETFVSMEWLYKEFLDYAKFTKQENKLPSPTVFSKQIKKRFNFKDARKNDVRGIKINHGKFMSLRHRWELPSTPEPTKQSQIDKGQGHQEKEKVHWGESA